jgi:hypothetical protein
MAYCVAANALVCHTTSQGCQCVCCSHESRVCFHRIAIAAIAAAAVLTAVVTWSLWLSRSSPLLHACNTFVTTAVTTIAAIAIVATTAVATAVALIIAVAALFGTVICDHRHHHLNRYHHDRCLQPLSCDHRCDHRYRLCDYHIVAAITIIIISIVIISIIIVAIIICKYYHVIVVVIIAVVSATVISSLWTLSLWSLPSRVPSLWSLLLLHSRLSSSRHRRCFYHCRSCRHRCPGQGRSRGPRQSRFTAAAARAVDDALLSLKPPVTLSRS